MKPKRSQKNKKDEAKEEIDEPPKLPALISIDAELCPDIATSGCVDGLSLPPRLSPSPEATKQYFASIVEGMKGELSDQLLPNDQKDEYKNGKTRRKAEKEEKRRKKEEEAETEEEEPKQDEEEQKIENEDEHKTENDEQNKEDNQTRRNEGQSPEQPRIILRTRLHIRRAFGGRRGRARAAQSLSTAPTTWKGSPPLTRSARWFSRSTFTADNSTRT
ncbi:hypothetical protein BLNAU_2167 [Blattamonas nauphoetae]|uniref:Uncharacterized protein n=1 Tax=Blattamonas nauphoetae TaxID=2049346 RepID=A0ABQ9YGM2_9EUKA|nr:hypothetical protein BLNAU_2167 [Blattamonas nauphoetae]